MQTSLPEIRHNPAKRISRHDLTTRWGEMIPGLAVLGIIVMGPLLVWYQPHILAMATAVFAGYIALRFVLATVAFTWGLRHIRRWEHTNWDTFYCSRKTRHSIPQEDVHHLVIIPNYDEPETLLARSLEQLAQYDRASTQMSVVLAMEDAEHDAWVKAGRLRDRFHDNFAQFWISVHPTERDESLRCKSANLAWALQQVRPHLRANPSLSAASTVVTVMDADTLWHPHYFESLTALFALSSQRYTTFWQAPLRYHGNVRAAPALMRPLHAVASAWELAYLAAPWWWKLPMSSYSVSLRLLEQCGGWDTSAITDDWRMFVKAFFATGLAVRVVPTFLPFQAHVVTGDGLRDVMRARYRQTVRHAWGAQEIGTALHHMRAHGTWKKPATWRLLDRLAHDHLLAGAGSLLLLMGTQVLPLGRSGWFANHLIDRSVLTIQLALIVTAAVTVLLAVVDLKLRECGNPKTKRQIVTELGALLVLPTMTALLVTLPAIHAYLRLLIGRPISFEVTPKQ